MIILKEAAPTENEIGTLVSLVAAAEVLTEIVMKTGVVVVVSAVVAVKEKRYSMCKPQ